MRCALAILSVLLSARVLRAQPPAPGAAARPAPDLAGEPGPAEPADAPAPSARPTVPMELDGCTSEEREVRRLVAFELDAEISVEGAPGRDAPVPGTTPPGLRVKVVCRDAQYRVYVVDADPEQTRTRGLDLRAMGPAVRPRFIALAIVEALTTRPLDSPPVVRVTREEDEEEPPQVEVAAPPAERITLLSARGLGRYFPVLGQATWGVGALLSYRLRERIEAELDLAGEGGAQRVALGEIDVRAVSVGAGVATLRRLGELTFRAGAGVRFGLVQLAGTGGTPDVRARAFAGPWTGPMLSAGVRVRLPRELALDVGAELGHALVQSTGRARATAADGSVRVESAGISGPWLALLASVGWSP